MSSPSCIIFYCAVFMLMTFLPILLTASNVVAPFHFFPLHSLFFFVLSCLVLSSLLSRTFYFYFQLNSYFLSSCLINTTLYLSILYISGYLAYAGGGKNSRGTQLIMAFNDNLYLGGDSIPFPPPPFLSIPFLSSPSYLFISHPFLVHISIILILLLLHLSSFSPSLSEINFFS